MNSEEKLQYVFDRIEIQDVITKYSIGQDTHQGEDSNILETWKDVFTKDAVLDYRAAGAAPCSYEEMAVIMRGDDTKKGNMNGPFTNWQHLVGNPVATVTGDTAIARTDLWATHKGKITEGGSPWSLYVAGAFADELVRTEQGWRISKRTLILHFMDSVTTNPMNG